MSGIAKNMKNMEAAGFGGCDGELENIKVTSTSENKNIDEVRVANPEEELDDWEREADEEEQVASAYVEDDEEAANVAKQMAEIEAAQKAALEKRREAEAKQNAARAKQLRDNKKRAARKPTLGLGPYTWLDALARGSDAIITADLLFKSYRIAVQKGLMALVGKSREAISYREGRTFEKMASIGYDGGGEGDETEGNIIKSQEKKLADRLSQIWKTMTTEAKEWAASVRGEKKMKAAASPSAGQTTSEQKPVSPVQAGQTGPAPNNNMFEDIMGMLARPPRDPRPVQPVQQPVQQPNERDAGFDRMAKAKADAETDPRKLICTRPCNEFKTGKPCVHIAGGKRCNWGHSLDRFQPKKCAWPTTCNKWMKRQGACECAHEVDGVVETPQAVMERLLACGSLVKPMPETEPVMVKKPTSPTVAAVQPRMSVDEKRAATHKHREQLMQMSGGGGVDQQRRAFVEIRPNVGKAPSENPWSKPVMRMPVKHVEDDIPREKVEPTTVSQSKPVLRCTPAMAAEMLLELKKAGIAADTVVLEIIGSN